MACKKPQITENINNHDAGIIDVLWTNVSQNFDAEVARKLVMQPDSIIHLISNNKTGLIHHELKCFYAVHAICLALVGDDCADVLNKMPGYNINALKRCLTVAKKHQRPDTNTINKLLAERSAGTRITSPEDYWINDAMIKSLKVALSINDLWEDAIAELQKWSDAVNNYKRPHLENSAKKIDYMSGKRPDDNSEVKENTEPKEAVELWTTDMLVEKLGCKNKATFQTKKG